MKIQRKYYDNHDRANDNNACHFLMNSLDAIKTLQDPMNDTSLVLFLWVVEYNAKHTSGHLDELKKGLKKMVPKNYLGQNILSMCAAICEKTDLLEFLNVYDHTITKEVCNCLLVAGGEVTTENVGQFHFSQELRDSATSSKLHISTLVSFLSQSRIPNLALQGLTIQSPINLIISSYTKQVILSAWLACVDYVGCCTESCGEQNSYIIWWHVHAQTACWLNQEREKSRGWRHGSWLGSRKWFALASSR
jgi:hypothetical protein